MSLFKRLVEVLQSEDLKVNSSHFVSDLISEKGVRSYVAKYVIGRFTDYGDKSSSEPFANAHLEESEGKIRLRLDKLFFHSLVCRKCGNSFWTELSVDESTKTVTINSENQCPIKKSEQTISRTIETSGELQFLNSLENGPEVNFETENISTLWGIKKFSKRHQRYNLAYVQTGGYTVVGIYRNKDGSEIIVADPDDARSLRKKEMEGFKLIGKIDCEVWSFIIKDSKDVRFQKSSRDANKTVSAKMKPGTYEITSHLAQRMDNPIWAKIKLLK